MKKTVLVVILFVLILLWGFFSVLRIYVERPKETKEQMVLVELTSYDNDDLPVMISRKATGLISIRGLAATETLKKRTLIDYTGNRCYLVKESCADVCKLLGYTNVTVEP